MLKNKKKQEVIVCFAKIAEKRLMTKRQSARIVEVAQNEQQPIDDSGSIGWGVLGCCIPVVGLILFLVWHDTKPKNAKAAGIGALVSVGIVILWYILVAVVGIGVGLGSASF